MTSRAFAPAHVSGLFAIHDEADAPLAKGSRGAGWSLVLGATATARRRATATGGNRISINGEPSAAPVTTDALQRLGHGAADLEYALRLDLPVGQGFGMSAAGTLACCLAACAELGLDSESALAATHAAEVASGTGLGDAIGSWHGAGEVRLRPGVPPHGWATRVEPPADAAFLFCVLGKGIPTPSIIRDAAWRTRTRLLGDAAVDRIVAAGRTGAWSAILRESQRFSQELGLMPQRMREVASLLPAGMAWGQAMLGNTMWVTGTAAELAAAKPVLATAGPVIDSGVDLHGARVLRA